MKTAYHQEMKPRALLLALLSLPPAATHAAPLRLLFSDQANPPWLEGSGPNFTHPPGRFVEMIQDASKRCGQDVTLARKPALRVQQDIRNRKAEGIVSVSWSPERARYLSYGDRNGEPDPAYALIRFTYVFYAKPGAGIRWDGRQLRGSTLPVGANLGWSVIDDLQRRGLTVEAGNDTDQLFSKLALGRIAAYAIQEQTAVSWLAAHPGMHFKRLDPPISSKYYYLAFSHDYARTHPAVTRCFREAIRKSGQHHHP